MNEASGALVGDVAPDLDSVHSACFGASRGTGTVGFRPVDMLPVFFGNDWDVEGRGFAWRERFRFVSVRRRGSNFRVIWAMLRCLNVLHTGGALLGLGERNS